MIGLVALLPNCAMCRIHYNEAYKVEYGTLHYWLLHDAVTHHYHAVEE